MFAKTIGILMLALTPIAATAQPSYINIEQRFSTEQMRATGLDTLKPEQLALLNRLLREAPEPGAPVQAAAPESKPTPASFFAMENKTIKDRLKGSVSGWDQGTVFTLENGQKWKVVKGSLRLPSALSAPEVLVVPGIAGRWFLQVDENYPKARVERIE